MIYLDNSATTQPCPAYVRAMTEALTGLPILAGIKDGDRDLSLSADRLAALYE